ncbi:hypothetical protein ACQKWADRAFT_283301 [Trichoderma austrokoningii]
MASRSPSREYRPSLSRSAPRSDGSRSPPPAYRRRRHDSRSPSRSPRSRSRSLTPPPARRNGRHRSTSRNRSRDRGRGSRSPSESPLAKSTKIVVERLSKNINEDHLYEIFGQFGHVKDLDLPINRNSGTNRGTAYILYDHEADAEAAISHMHEAQVDGTVINVSIVLQRRKLSPAPPTARRGANIDPRVPFQSSRGGGGSPSGPMGGGGGRRRLSPASRYGPRSDVYRPNSLSPARSPGGGPPARGGGGGSRYRSRSNDSYSSRSRSRSPGPRRRGGGNGAGRRDDHDTRRRSRSRSFDDDRNTGRTYR